MSKERITGLIDKLSNAEDYGKASWLLRDPVENIALSVVDDTQRENVDFQSKAGLRVRVIRQTVPSGEKWPCPWCAGLEGEYIAPDIPPEVWHRHENCRCLIAYENEGTGTSTILQGNRNANKKKWYTPEELEAIKNRLETETIQTAPHNITETNFTLGANAKGVKYVEVQDLTKSLTTDEIVARVGGADKTSGSCASLAHTYAGNKKGYDVLDFRGGLSRDFVSERANSISLYEEIGAKPQIVRHTNDFTAVHDVIKGMEPGKEYILHTGKHASVVKKSGKGFYMYLELQREPEYNGWVPFTGSDKAGVDDTLRFRFGCQRSHTTYGSKREVPTVLVDIDNIPASDEYKSALGYINTPESEQIKGVGGYAK